MSKPKNTYSVEGKPCKDFPKAADLAIMLSLQRDGEDVAIVETEASSGDIYYINVQASSEKG